MKLLTYNKQFVVCINNEGNEASLERRKIYRVIPDAKAHQHQMIRILDESGETYLYPATHFLPIKLSQPVLKAFSKAA